MVSLDADKADLGTHGGSEGAVPPGEAWLRSLLEALPSPAWLAQADGAGTWFNEAWLRLVGAPKPDAPWWEAVAPAALAQVEGRWLESLGAGRAFAMEVPIPGAGGRDLCFQIQAQPVPVPAGTQAPWLGLCTDLSPRQAAQEQILQRLVTLAASNEVFQEALEMDSEARVALRCLEVAQQFTGSRSGVIGLFAQGEGNGLLAQHCSGRGLGFEADGGAQGWPSAWIEALRAGHTLQEPVSSAGTNLVAVPLRTGDRTFGFLALADRVPAFTPGDLELALALAAAFRLAHERLRSERTVQDLNLALERRTREMAEAITNLDAFAHSVSHDLRAPLRHLTGFAELLEQELGADLPGQSRRYLGKVVSAATFMGRLIDELLDFSRSGRSLRREAVDLEELVREVIQELGPQTQGRQVHWEVAALPGVQGDRTLLHSVFTNLLGNALKFTRARPEARIEVGLEVEPSATVVFVRDNGVGFNPRFAHKLFGVFQRLHAAQEYEGTGIGLANVRKIIASHGGRTWAEGALDQGATFYLTLPKVP